MTNEENTQLLLDAAYAGNVLEVKRLIPISNPKAHDSYALLVAMLHGHIECVDLLFDVSDTLAVLYCFQSNYPNHPKTWQYLENKTALQQRAVLTRETQEFTDRTTIPVRKM